uniref:Transmembrane protein 161A n=1 Tax=Ovis aries TaxID=9940 RepID=A0AC11D498_SHEEP
MAVLGVQLVVTLLTATLMHRLAPHCSFARWLLCNGSLFRYKHPSEEELRALAGKQKPRGRKERRASGCIEEKPLSVPRDAPFQLETCPLTAVDALVLRFFLEYQWSPGRAKLGADGVLSAVLRIFLEYQWSPGRAKLGADGVLSAVLRFFLEYQWFVDFAVYSGGVYLFTEAYYYVLGPAKETNIAVFWCLLTIAFSVKVFLTVTRLYFSAEEGGERSVCLTFAFLFLLLAMLAQVVREETLELGLEPGLDSMSQNLEPLLKMQGWDWALPLVKLAIRVGLAVVGSMLGAFLTFPGLRLAQTHHDALTMSEDRPMLQLLLHTSFLSPLFVLWLWTKPMARDFLHQAPLGRTSFSLLSDSAFDSLRLWVLVVLCLLRLAVTRPHLQAYLCLAKTRVEQLRREAGRIEAREIQQRVVRVYCYVTVVSLQYLTPLILTLNCTLLLKTLGGYSWGLGPVPTLSPTPPSAHDGPVGPEEDEAQQTAALIAGALGSLLTPLFLRGVLAFLIWWIAACQLLSSLFGLYFHQHLAGS